MTKEDTEWFVDCMHWRGRVLRGKYRRWCQDWDGLPIDETTPEWPCVCATELRANVDGMNADKLIRWFPYIIAAIAALCVTGCIVSVVRYIQM